MHVCLISPGHFSTNPRLLKEARALTEAGYKVSIVCGRYSTWAREQDIKVADPNWDISYVAFGPFEAPKPTYLMQSLARRLALSLARAGVDHQSVLEIAHSPTTRGLIRASKRIRADLYIAHYVAALPAAAATARRHTAPYAFDAEDYHLGDLPDAPRHSLEKRIIRAIEGRYLPGAAYVTAASPLIAEAYAETYGIARPNVVLNVFPRTHGPSAPSLRGLARPGPSLYWFSQTIGSGRGLETAVAAIARAASRPHLYLRGTPAAGYESQLRAVAAQGGVGEKLHFLAPAAPDELERLAAEYDLGYSGETGFSRNNMLALGNKLFSYLTSGLPVLASDIEAHRRIVPEFGEAMTLFSVGDADRLAAALDRYLLDPSRLATARKSAWRLGHERYCWEAEQGKLLAAVTGALAKAQCKPGRLNQGS